jgi:O-antigen ligase
MSVRASWKPLNWIPLQSSTAALVIFSIFFIGSRNPLKIVGIELSGSRELFWALTALILAILFRVCCKSNFREISSLTTLVRLWLLPIVYFSTLVIFSMISSRPSEEIQQLFAMTILVAAAVTVSPLMRAENLALFWLVVVVFLACCLIVAWVSGPQGPDGHYEALSVGRITFGRFMAIGAVITGFLASFRGIRWLYAVSLAFMIFAALTGSRGVLVALIATGALWILIGTVRRRWTVGFSAVALSVFALLTFGPWPIPVLRDRFALLSPTYSAGRDRIWSEAGADALSSPSKLITGVAERTSVPMSDAPVTSDPAGLVNTHNIFLDSLAQAGLIGLTLLILVLVMPLPSIFRAVRANPIVALPVLLLFLVFVSAQFSGTQYDNVLLWFFFVLSVGQAKLVLDTASDLGRVAAVPNLATN